VTTARDGSPVPVYARLPERGEGELVAAGQPPPARVLELGCGAGRITRQLLARGYSVTAVDESPEMLAHVPAGAEIVRASIEGLDLRRRFELVLLASNLLTVPAAQRESFLETCRRHADSVVVEALPLGWRPRSGESRLGDVTVRLTVDSVEGGLVTGAVDYRFDGGRYRQPFAMRVFADDDELAAALADGGFALERWLDRGRGWFVARVL
jgi:SAM-dependent methyltransferase